ncbi:MAG: hypothetical protein IT174_13230 [Acidobacteria bacterium]|nr:hypothetical protein [Acidobacteriota bacterium]
MKTNTVCYEGIQRIFRNAVVGYLRKELTNAFPEDVSSKLSSSFTVEEWERTQKHAHGPRNTGALSLPIKDDFDILSVNHFFSIFDRYYEVLVHSKQPAPTNDSKEKGQQKKKLLEWFKTIKDLRDPLSHPADDDFSREDAYVLLDSARRALIRINLVNEADEIKKLMDQMYKGGSVKETVNPLEAELPARESVVMDFIGRDLEIGQLREWFSDPMMRRWALAGKGGLGKSALAYKFALDVVEKAPPPFQTVIWLSAKKKRFVEGKSVDISTPDFSDLESALDLLLAHFGWLEAMDQAINAKQRQVLELLDQFPAFIVVDDIDSLESENENVIEFFSIQVPQTKSKVLFTSRRVIFGMGGTTTHVKGLAKVDAEAFVSSRCEQMGFDPSVLPKEVRDDIISVTEASPLYIEDLIRLIAIKQPREAIKLWKEKGGIDARKYTLGRECELLTEDALKVLLTACIAQGRTSMPEIEAVLGIDSLRVAAALQELQKLFLVPLPSLVEGEQRFEVNANTRALVREVHGQSDQFRRLLSTYRKVTTGVSSEGKYETEGIARQSVFFVKVGKFEEAETLLLNAIARFPSNAELIGLLGWVYKKWPPARVVDARERSARAAQLRCERFETLDHWCDMEIAQKEWRKAAAAAESAMRIFPGHKKLLYYSGYARSRFGRELINSFQDEKGFKEIDAAKKQLKLALDSKNEFSGRREELNSRIYRALVLACEAIGDRDGLDHYFSRWKKHDPDDYTLDTEWNRISRTFRL